MIPPPPPFGHRLWVQKDTHWLHLHFGLMFPPSFGIGPSPLLLRIPLFVFPATTAGLTLMSCSHPNVRLPHDSETMDTILLASQQPRHLEASPTLHISTFE